MPSTLVSPASAAELNGIQKVAVLCMGLGPDDAAMITRGLAEDDVEAIGMEMAKLHDIPAQITAEVMNEWLEMAQAAEMIAVGGDDAAMRFLEASMGPQRASYAFKRIKAQISDEAALLHLRKADAQQLAAVLRHENPQLIALILTHLDPPQTAGVIKEMEPDISAMVIYRMGRMEKVDPEMLKLIETTIGKEMDLNTDRAASYTGGPQAVAAVMNLILPSLEKELMEKLALQDKELCEEVKNLMFVFEDLVNLDPKSTANLVKELTKEPKNLALALKGASEELKAKIKGAMSKRAVEALEEEMEFLGLQRIRDVEAAQMEIVSKVRKLEEAGEIVISSGGEDEFI